MRLDELESALREATDAQPPVSPRASEEIVQRVRRRRRRHVLAALGVVALAVPLSATMRATSNPTTTVVAGQNTEETRAWPTKPAHVGISREEVMEWVRQRTSGRIDRVEAKLVTWGEYQAVRPEPIGHSGAVEADTFVWVVVVAGDLRAPRTRLGVYPAFTWAVWVLRADDATALGSHLTREEIWPSWYRRLVDRGGHAGASRAQSGAVEGDAQAVERCQAALGNSDAVLVAAFLQTLGEVDDWVQRRLRRSATTPGAGPPPSPAPMARSQEEAEKVVAVCWVDGPAAVSAPRPADGSPPVRFDRSVFLVHEDGTKRGLMATTRDQTPVVRPSDDA